MLEEKLPASALQQRDISLSENKKMRQRFRRACKLQAETIQGTEKNQVREKYGVGTRPDYYGR